MTDAKTLVEEMNEAYRHKTRFGKGHMAMEAAARVLIWRLFCFKCKAYHPFTSGDLNEFARFHKLLNKGEDSFLDEETDWYARDQGLREEWDEQEV